MRIKFDTDYVMTTKRIGAGRISAPETLAMTAFKISHKLC
ncbi:MAG: hypothetical protein RL248_807 [Pseudomonadota bacterium]